MTQDDLQETMIPVPVRFLPARKQAIIETARAAGYRNYTAWMRDLCEAQIADGLYALKPKDGK